MPMQSGFNGQYKCLKAKILNHQTLSNHSNLTIKAKRMTVPDDVLAGCRQNERAAQERLYRLCYEPFLRLCLRYANNRDDAATILNKAFFNILTRIGQYNGEGALIGWMKRIVINAAVDYVRANQRFRYHEPVENAEEMPGQSMPADQELTQHDLLTMLHDLPYTSGAVFNLFAIEGYAHREIAQMLGITETNSKWHLHNARKLLQKQLTDTATL